MHALHSLAAPRTENPRGNRELLRSVATPVALSPAMTLPRSSTPSAGSMDRLGDTPSPDRVTVSGAKRLGRGKGEAR